MDKNKIKSFAIWARRKMIESVTEKAERIGIYKDKIYEASAVQGGFKVQGKEEIFTMPKEHRDTLVEQVNKKGFEQVIEEVAYTWFNRFMGLRYMEVNDYLPSGVRILSSEVDGKTEPDVLTKVSEIIDELSLNAEEIYELLDSGKTEDREKAYRTILVKQCNELGKIIPQMFEKISDYTELLLPDNLLEEGSVIRKMVEDIEESDWKEEVEIIGWMYQYYISEKKDEVFAALKRNVKITKENIPAATQLFTPKWIVKYMVENSLGRLWLEGHPNEELQKEWKYYLEEAEQEPEVEEELKKIREEYSKLRPEDIKVLDPCMGSGHILVYAFDVLYEIYKTAGYSEREIPRIILQNNIYGLDIDDRSAQLASFALIMKARHYNRRLFREIEREHLELNLCSIQESNSIGKEEINYFCSLNTGLNNEELRKDLEYLVTTFTDAKEYGSILEVKKVNSEELKQRLKEIEQENNFVFADYRKILLEKLPILIQEAEIMSSKYEICITNPPYIGNGNMDSILSNYTKCNYNNSKNDLYAVFIEKCLKYSTTYIAMITQHTWMFVMGFEKLRRIVLGESNIHTMIHLGSRAFEEISGEVVQSCAFVLRKNRALTKKSTFIRLTEFDSSLEKEKIYLSTTTDYFNKFRFNNVKSDDYEKISGLPIAYWLSNNMINCFSKGKLLNEISDLKTGLSTMDNNRFLRFWYEVVQQNISFNSKSHEDAICSRKKWFPYIKGGINRKWYGNRELVVNWYNDGKEIKEKAKGASGGRVVSTEYYFKESLTWSYISTSNFALRYNPVGSIFDSIGTSCFPFDKKQTKYVLGLLNTNIVYKMLQVLAPTMAFNPGSVGKIPVIQNLIKEERIREVVDRNIEIAKTDWNSFEISWDFNVQPLVKLLDQEEIYKIESVFNVWERKCEEAFEILKANEEELNRIFIDIYGLQDELTPEVEDKDITIRKADRERDIKSFISYAVGCMFGRYSIDSEGLIYAGGEFNDKWKFDENKVRKIEKDEDGNIVSDSWVDSRFMPDADNIIPITEDEYFEDDIVSRFIAFVRTVYGEDTLEENLDFIADSIGRKASETSRQAIRRYFLKDFYKDHLKVYQKRPIYWMLESGKNNGFKALIYMHRYNDQTVAKVRTEYLHTLQRKYEAEIERLKLIIDSEEYIAKDRTAAKKKMDKITKQIEECKEYDELVAYLANEKINIDLDDGVKVNYGKFQDVSIINSKGKEIDMNLLSKI